MRKRPMLYLLAGLPCSGKSTHSRKLEGQGVKRVDVDRRMVTAAGRLGVDYPVEDHAALLAPVLERALFDLRDHLRTGSNVVLDHGLGRRSERDALKVIARNCGANWTLIRFDADIETLRSRCADRLSKPDGPHAMPITDTMLDFLISVYEPPHGEGETVITTGNRQAEANP